MRKQKNIFKFFLTLLMFLPLAFVSSCANSFDPNAAMKAWSEKDFSQNTQLFFVRPSSLSYFFTTSLITTIAEKQIQKNETCNVIQILDETIWDYTSKKPNPTSSFPYNFQNYYSEFGGEYEDMWTKEDCSSGINLGMFTNTKDIDEGSNDTPINVEEINLKTIQLFVDVLESKTISADNFDLYIDELLLQKLWMGHRFSLFAILCRTSHIYVITQGMLAENIFIPSQYYEHYVAKHKAELSIKEKRKRWNSAFKKTKIGSPEFDDNYTLNWAGSERAREKSSLYNFIDWEEKWTYFNFETEWSRAYPTKNKKPLRINNIYLDILDYAKNFNISEEAYKSVFSKVFLNAETIPTIASLMDEDTRTSYDPDKPNVIFMLGKEWSEEYIAENTNDKIECDKIFSAFINMLKKYAKIFDPTKYNYIFKGHPRHAGNIFVDTNYFATGDSRIKPLMLKREIPMELILDIDLINHAHDGKYELFNPNNYESDDIDYKQCKSVFAGYYTHSTTIYTAMCLMSQKQPNASWGKNIHQKIIPTEIEFLMDEFRTDGMLKKNMGGKSIYSKEESYQINFDFYTSVFFGLNKIDHFPLITNFSKFSDWIK